MPTQEQLVERFKAGTKEDQTGLWYEFSGKLLIRYLPFEFLRNDFVKSTATDEEIREIMVELNRDEVLKEAKEYLSFAYEKCHDERGISANRSILHFIEWFWLAGEEDFSNKIYVKFHENYHSYGEEILDMISNKLDELGVE